MKLAYVDSCIWITSLEGMQDHRASVRAALGTLAGDGWELCTSDAVHCSIAAHGGCELFVTTDPHFSGLKAVPSTVIRL